MPSQDSLTLRGGTQTSFVYGCCSCPRMMGVWYIGPHAPPFPLPAASATVSCALSPSLALIIPSYYDARTAG